MKHSFGFILIGITWSLSPILAQPNIKMGTIRGYVYDKETEQGLPGAAVLLLNSNPPLGSISDSTGRFVLKEVPPGRQSLMIRYPGYETYTVNEVLVSIGKEVLVDAGLQESVINMQEVVVEGKSRKEETINEFSSVSARSFSLEEVSRFSGGRNDAARMVSSFAGVAANNDSRNDIVVRGNSPTGVLWRLEGVPIPNPNHFSTAGTTGGPVTALNTNLLKNSDFLTGAFAAEYGNANAAVFDVGFRSGNTQKHEFSFQLAAFTGLEFLAEGPLKKSKPSSYLLSARYSFAGIAARLGAPIGTSAIPEYGDFSFKFDLPSSEKKGKFSMFGIGGYSKINFIGKKISETDFYSDPYLDRYVQSGLGILGFKHSINIDDKSYFKTVVSASISASLVDEYVYPDSVNREQITAVKDFVYSVRTHQYYNRKFSSKLSLRSGLVSEFYIPNTKNRERSDMGEWRVFNSFNGFIALLQPYSQVQYKPFRFMELNAGLHGMYMSLSSSYSIEPRISVKFIPQRSHSITLAYGWHSQMQVFPIYFYRNTLGDQPNKNLDFNRAHHFVLAYDVKFAKDWRVKLEGYFQHLTGIPIDTFSSSFSMANSGADFVFPQRSGLVNKGLGRNYGVEFTLEKFFSKQYYGLITVSLFDSKYRGSDGVWRNTVFNNQFVLNFLAGKEFRVGKDKRHTISIDLRTTYAGGRWYTPVDLESSRASGTEILFQNQAFSKQYPNYFRMDLKLGVRINGKKVRFSNSLFVDFNNLTFRKNIFEQRYSTRTGNISTVYQIGFFPDVTYRFQF